MKKNKTSAGNPGRSFEESLEKYQVYSPLEIGRILKALQVNKQLIRMSFAGVMETVITSVVDVNVTDKVLMLDAPPVPAQNEMALKSSMISFEGALDRIRISFTVNRVYQDTVNGVPAFRVSFPDRLVRLQRRDHFRVPVSNSTLHIPVEVDGVMTNAVGNIRDLSSAGACVIDASIMLDDTVGKIYPDCRLNLPGTQSLSVTLEVRNSHELPRPGNSPQRRIGCQFVNLSSSVSALIQRYITRAERQQKRLTG